MKRIEIIIKKGKADLLALRVDGEGGDGDLGFPSYQLSDHT